MKKTLFSIIMSMVMVLMVCTCVFAFTDGQQSEIISVLENEGFANQRYRLSVPADIQLRSSDGQQFLDELSIEYTGEPQFVDAMATLDMTVVKDTYDTFTNVVETLFRTNYPEDAQALNAEFDQMFITGNVTVTINIPDGMTVAENIVIGDGFSDNVSVFFDMVSQNVIDQEIIIEFKIKDGMTKAQLEEYAESLSDFKLICEDLSVVDSGIYELSGTVDGEIYIVCPKTYVTAHTIEIVAVETVGNSEREIVTENLYVTEESEIMLSALSIVEDSIVSYQNPSETIENEIMLQDLSSTENYTVNLEITGVTTTTTQFLKYADGETPYVVERIIPMEGYTGAISDILVDGTSIDYVVENGVIKAYTDLIDADGVNITVVTSDDTRLRSWIGEGKSTEPGSFTVNGKVDQIISNEFGVLVSRNGQYDNIVPNDSHTGDWDETTTLSFKAPMKNKNGVFVMRFDQLDYGTYYFAVYTKSATDMRYDIRDANDEFVIYTYAPDPSIPSRPGTSTVTKREPGKVVACIDDEQTEYTADKNGVVDVDSIEVPEAEGKQFEGWYYDELFTKPVEDSIKVEDGKTVYIYAKFVNAKTPDKFETSDEHFAYIIGYPDGTVRPEDNISREEIATIFYRLMTDEYRAEIASTTNDFTDVEADRWSNKAISTMANGGYIQGYNGEFKPEDAITRAEFVTIAARFLETDNEAKADFTDIEGHWAKEYIDATSNALWINGYEDGTFRPDNFITRAESMAIFNRILCRRVDSDGLIEGTVYFPDVADTDWFVYEVLEATNSHKCERADAEVYENWTELLPNRDWTKY